MGWKSVKSLFWQEGEGTPPQYAQVAPGEGAADVEEMSDEQFAALLSEDEFGVPAEAHEPVDVATVHYSNAEGEALSIDFQEQYDLASIPNTDEVEQLESFLERLDTSLPHASRIAAAQAFLGAIGKGKDDVLADAERKIKRIHGIKLGKEQEITREVADEEANIAELSQQIEAHRSRIQELQSVLEGVHKACAVEEGRLQAVRVFFGRMDAKA